MLVRAAGHRTTTRIPGFAALGPSSEPGAKHAATPLVEHRLAKIVARGDLTALIAKRDAVVPVGYMGTAWDVAHAVLFLVSDEARYITGTEIVVDGGMSAAGMG
jgi:NAD(P)-dependent dehydrogenase (short-subunit alcohol dehydrogenase family)